MFYITPQTNIDFLILRKYYLLSDPAFFANELTSARRQTHEILSSKELIYTSTLNTSKISQESCWGSLSEWNEHLTNFDDYKT